MSCFLNWGDHMNIISVETLIAKFEDFLKNDYYSEFVVGELAGSNVLKYIAQIAASEYGFKNVLFVSGIQDDVYNGHIIGNQAYWASLFDDIDVDGVEPYSIFAPRFYEPKLHYTQEVVKTMIAPFKFMVIYNAHKIPKELLNKLTSAFRGKYALIVDPFDEYGENWSFADTVTDAFDPTTKVIGFARYLYGYDTRRINKKIKNIVSYDMSITKRSVGRIDGRQYVTLDPYLYSDTIERQKQSPLRKNHKIMILSNCMNIKRSTEMPFPHALTYGTILQVTGVMNKQPKFILHASKINMTFTRPLVYEIDPFRTPKDAVLVTPANILSVKDAALHKFRDLVFVTTNTYPSVSIRQQYALLKTGMNVYFATLK